MLSHKSGSFVANLDRTLCGAPRYGRLTHIYALRTLVTSVKARGRQEKDTLNLDRKKPPTVEHKDGPQRSLMWERRG
ncbi:hypothetical protein TRAPUB_7132 [Trametes pubescens]|uniref:Uncharacterized protein n=1 Tax=Trametes pubescens TaxID=154538 RepID=A0A1M2V3Z9_TRAPU|nr:hypothetical protein TRAPUB_7132 [Trametes pubescens]